MKTVIVKKPYLKYSIGETITVRDQDAALLIPRGVVIDAEMEVKDETDEDVIKAKPAKTMTTKTILKKK